MMNISLALKFSLMGMLLTSGTGPAAPLLPAGQVQVSISNGGPSQPIPFEKVIQVDKDGAWAVDVKGPDGAYEVTWPVKVPASPAYKFSAELFKSNANQINHLLVSLNGGRTWYLIENDKDWTWQTKENQAFDLMTYVEGTGEAKTEKTVLFSWRFTKPHPADIWRTAVRKVSLAPISAQDAVREFKTPLAKGLPEVALPPKEGIVRKPKWEIKDETLLRDGKPYFPIGFVMFNTDDKHLGQAVAMGANSVHTEIGWSPLMKNKTEADPVIAREVKERLERIGRWGMTAFPLMTGHYVPDWFAQANPTNKAFPVGSDGKLTGAWFPYSIHYPPFRDAIADYWRTVVPLFNSQPATLAINTWNEPAYGGIWCKPEQYGDYSVWSIENFRTWLKTKYASLPELNKQWNTQFTEWAKVDPPRSPDQINRRAWIDWMRFGQQAFAGFFDWERSVIHAAVPDARLVHKKQVNLLDNSACASGTNWALMSRSEDFFGLNAYEGPSYETTMNTARSYAGGKPVIVFETNVMPPNAESRTPERIRKSFWSQIVGGLRGMFIFCFDPDPEHGLLNDAAVLPEARGEYVRFIQTVNRFGDILALPNAPATIAVIYSTSTTLNYPNSPRWPNAFHGAYSLVRNSQYGLDVLPEEKCDAETLKKYKVVVLPSYTILPDPQMQALDGFVRNGGCLLAFGHSLDRGEYFDRYTQPPKCLGLQTREKPIGDREQLRVSVHDKTLMRYNSEEFEAEGIEKVTSFKEKVDQLVAGKGLTLTDKVEKILAMNSDSYPAVLTTRQGRVVYCAFDSKYSEPLRRMVEGILREQFHVTQPVRLAAESKVAYAPVMTRLIHRPGTQQDYLLILNTSGEEKTLSLETTFKPGKELFHPTASMSNGKFQVKPYEVYLLELF